MSCVIAIKDIKKDTLFLGTDIQCTIDESTKLDLPESECKIVDSKQFVIGVTGDLVMNSIIREIDVDSAFSSPPRITEFGSIRRYTELLNVDPTFELLIVDKTSGIVYTVDSSFSITTASFTVDDRYAVYAIGSGHIDARGFLVGRLKNNKDVNLEDIIEECFNYVGAVNNTVSQDSITYIFNP